MLGPGLLSGLSGNDATAVTSYAINGATIGFSQLWLMMLSTPLYQAVVYACGKIGRVTQLGLTEALRKYFGRKLALPIAFLLVTANVALITGDLVAIATAIELITGIPWIWFVAPVAAILWYIAVFQSFGVIKRIFLTLGFAFVAYLITGVLSHANWGAVLRDTVVPHINLGFASVSSAVALLGATLSPFTMFWQTQGEKEQDRPGTMRQQTRLAALDVASGTIGGNLIAYFIVLTTAATLYSHHRRISSAADAARALAPLFGPFAKYLFAVGFIGAGVVAVPVLLASTSYALSGAFGWPASLWRKPWRSEGFYSKGGRGCMKRVGHGLAQERDAGTQEEIRTERHQHEDDGRSVYAGIETARGILATLAPHHAASLPWTARSEPSPSCPGTRPLRRRRRRRSPGSCSSEAIPTAERLRAVGPRSNLIGQLGLFPWRTGRRFGMMRAFAIVVKGSLLGLCYRRPMRPFHLKEELITTRRDSRTGAG